MAFEVLKRIGLLKGKPEHAKEPLPELRISSLADKEARQRAVEAMNEGKVIPFQLVSVFGFLANAKNQAALEAIGRIKGEEGSKTYSTLMLAEDVHNIIKKEAVNQRFAHLIESPEALAQRVGLFTFLRIPVRDDMIDTIPKPLRSELNGETVIHVLMPDTHPHMKQLLEEFAQAGIHHIAVTSANRAHEKELIHQEDMLQLLQGAEGIGELLIDPLHTGNLLGSYSIVDAMSGDLFRQGAVEDNTLERVLGAELNKDNAKQRHPEYAPLAISPDVKTQEGVRLELLRLMHRQD